MNNVEFDEIEVVSEDGKVKVCLEYIGEGYEGDYNPEDSLDLPLLRYSVYRLYEPTLEPEKIAQCCDTDAYKDGDWMAVNDASYCTQLSANDDREKLEKAAKYLLNQAESDVRDLKRNKRLWEELSWVDVRSV